MNPSMKNKRDIIKVLDELLIPRHFVRVKDNWYLDNQECVSVIGLDKSLYGGQFSISTALLLKELAPELLPHPPFHLCNFRMNIKFISPNWNELQTSLNLENDLLPANRKHIITTAITLFALPFITSLNSKQSIAHEYKINEDFEPYCNLDLKFALERAGYLSKEELKLNL